jgi:predicted transcriptional regulator
MEILMRAVPDDGDDELAQIALEVEMRRHGPYDATPEELRAIDEGLAAVARGEIASDEEVEAIFAKYRQA